MRPTMEAQIPSRQRPQLCSPTIKHQSVHHALCWHERGRWRSVAARCGSKLCLKTATNGCARWRSVCSLQQSLRSYDNRSATTQRVPVEQGRLGPLCTSANRAVNPADSRDANTTQLRCRCGYASVAVRCPAHTTTASQGSNSAAVATKDTSLSASRCIAISAACSNVQRWNPTSSSTVPDLATFGPKDDMTGGTPSSSSAPFVASLVLILYLLLTLIRRLVFGRTRKWGNIGLSIPQVAIEA